MRYENDKENKVQELTREEMEQVQGGLGIDRPGEFGPAAPSVYGQDFTLPYVLNVVDEVEMF